MRLSPEEKAVGQANFTRAVETLDRDGLTRRDFLKAGALAVAVPTAAMGGFYFGYSKVNDPVRVGVIGTGDEGSVLISNISPDYLDVVAVSDIRPYNVWRAFHGDPKAMSARQGLIKRYGYANEDDARKHVKVYEDYHEMLKDPNIEAVIVAVPLVAHAPIVLDALKAGKHVLTEKLMAKTIGQCKEMGRTAQAADLLLATGHQRHYSVLYENAVQTIKNNLIGDIHHIRAQWHRGNKPGKGDTWKAPMPDEMEKRLVEFRTKLENEKDTKRYKAIQTEINWMEKLILDKAVDAGKWGYSARPEGGPATALEELIRWRLWDRTGGGLMAELGSHQLDAATIFISAMRNDGKKARPLAVTAVGGRELFPPDRECDDHVYCIYEFPTMAYEAGDKNKKVCVTYSSINGNGFGGYGEVVMGTDGTLILEREQEAMLYRDSATTTPIKVEKGKDGGAVMNSYETGGGGGPAAAGGGPGGPAAAVSRGYTEEMEHFAWCIRNKSPENLPRCKPEVAMADAIVALTANIAMKQQRRIVFKDEWFDINHNATPEDELKVGTQPV